MLTMLRDLTDHKGYANAALLKAIRQHGAAYSDAGLRTLLHHILIANRFWLLACLSEPFHNDEESRIPDALEPLIANYRATHAREVDWLSRIGESELERTLEGPLIPGGRCSVSDALIQVSLHSQGHRSQCATLLRQLGGTPPTTDFILWVKGRQRPAW
jgi:uncharacterized damage-inducible protein DinB